MQKILVVDDVADNVKLLSYDLEDAGYEVLTAYSANEALDHIRKEGPQILVTDWMMPEMDGIDLCKAIRKNEESGFVYIIMLTAIRDKERLVEAFDAGANDFLSKPFHTQELLARVNAGVRIVRLESDLATKRLEIHKGNAELAVVNEKLNRLATTDELTGLSNRREAIRILIDQWVASDRHGEHMSCIMFDIDHFKLCNDTYGHDMGDAVLRNIAKMFKQSIRAGEYIFRMGGEEFLMICPHTNLQMATKAADRIRAYIESHTVCFNDIKLQITISAGVAQRNDAIKNPDILLKRADQALYEAKQNGRNRVWADALSNPPVSENADSHENKRDQQKPEVIQKPSSNMNKSAV